ncbi:MAG: ABC transporter ATP-binding protein [Paracoccaceae bacterium]
MLTAHNIRVSHASRHGTICVVKDASLECQAGTVTILRGPSGSGKSSLFSVLAGIAACDSGEVLLCGQPISGMSDRSKTALRRSDVALVFQAYNLLPTLSALENVLYPLRRAGVPDAQNRAMAALEHLEVAHRAHLRPGFLSGGEQQRVAVARALAMRPKVLLGDEPTGALDRDNTDHVMRTFQHMARHDGTTVFLISHDPSVLVYADQILELNKGVLSNVA